MTREQYVVAFLDRAAASGIEKTALMGLGESLRLAWQAGFDAAQSGERDVMRDEEQLQHAVLAGIRCYRGHHPTHPAAKGLAGWESSSLTKRIVGSLKSLAQGHALQAGSRAQLKRQRRDARRAAAIDPLWCGACYFSHDPALGCLEAAQACEAARTVDAVDPSAATPGTPTPREKGVSS